MSTIYFWYNRENIHKYYRVSNSAEFRNGLQAIVKENNSCAIKVWCLGAMCVD